MPSEMTKSGFSNFSAYEIPEFNLSHKCNLHHSACQWLRWGAKHSPSTLECILIQCVVLNLSGPSIDLCSKFSHSGYVLILRSWSRPFHAYLPITEWRLWWSFGNCPDKSFQSMDIARLEIWSHSLYFASSICGFFVGYPKARCLLEYHDRHQIVDSGKVQCPTDWVRQLSYIILRQCNKHAGVSSSTKEKSFWCRSSRPALLTAPASLFNQAFAAWLHSRAFSAEEQTVRENPLTDRLRLQRRRRALCTTVS